MCDMTHSYVWHDSFICVTWLIHMCDMTHSYVWHNSFICCDTLWYASAAALLMSHIITHATYECTTHISHYMYDLYAAVEACRTVRWAEWHIQTWVVVMSHIWMSHVTFMNESCHTCEWVMSHINVLLGSWMCYSDHHTVRHACTAAYRSYI